MAKTVAMNLDRSTNCVTTIKLSFELPFIQLLREYKYYMYWYIQYINDSNYTCLMFDNHINDNHFKLSCQSYIEVNYIKNNDFKLFSKSYSTQVLVYLTRTHPNWLFFFFFLMLFNNIVNKLTWKRKRERKKKREKDFS